MPVLFACNQVATLASDDWSTWMKDEAPAASKPAGTEGVSHLKLAPSSIVDAWLERDRGAYDWSSNGVRLGGTALTLSSRGCCGNFPWLAGSAAGSPASVPEQK